MSITKFSSEEVIDLMEAKVNDGVIKLEDISQIISDDRFPDTISNKALKKLRIYSPEFTKYEELKKNWMEPSKLINKLYDENTKEFKKRIAEFKKTKGNSPLFIEESDEFKERINQLLELFKERREAYDSLRIIFNKVK